VTVLAGVALLVVFLLVAGHHNEQEVARRWDMMMNPEGLRVYSEVADQISWERRMAQTSYDDAAQAHVRGDSAEALRFLDVGSRVVGDCSTSVLALLRNMATLSRYAAAIAPVPPLRPSSFHARQLATLAGLHQLGHHLLLTTRERLHFRIGVLTYGVRAATWLALRATWALRTRMADPRRWRRVDEVRGDLGTLTDESLDTLRAVLASLAAVAIPAEGQPARTTGA
jgi:hypothetical protein